MGLDNFTGEKMANKVRMQYFDCVKGIAILSIVLGHMVGFNGRMLEDGWLLDFLFTYHVPVFLIISGYFLKVQKHTEKKYAKRLLIPYFFAVVILTVLFTVRKLCKFILTGEKFVLMDIVKYWLIAGMFGAGGRTDFLGIEFPRIGAIWFLLALLWAVLILCLVVKISRKINNGNDNVRIIIALSCAISIVGILSAQYCAWLPLSIQSGTAAIPFVLIGYILRQQFQYNKNCLFIALVIWCFAIIRSVAYQRLSVCNAVYPDPILNIAGGGAAAYALLVIMKWCEEKRILQRTRKLLAFFGRNSMVVLVFHLIETKIFPWRFIYHFVPMPIVAFLLIYILKIVWATIWIIIVNRIQILKEVFY